MRPSLSVLIARWEEARQQGRQLSAQEICHDCPDLIVQVERLLANLAVTPTDAAPDAATNAIPSETSLTDVPTVPPVIPTAAGMASVPPGYVVLSELGRGGMGVVYKAWQIGLNRIVALKMILSGSHASEEERIRFLAEAEAVAAIHHPGIVQVYQFGSHDDLPFLVMEFCPRGSLSNRLRDTPLPPYEAAQLVEQLAHAAHAAHGRNIVHRDIKPGNVLFDEKGEPKITDFGLARRLVDDGMTVTGKVIGTPSYMPPEQARSERVSPAADVYALGATLYECLTGRPPFKAATIGETLLQVLSEEPVSVRSLQPKTPADLETICLKCLQKEPGKRYASAEDLAEDLRRWQAGEAIEARPVGRLEKAWKWVKRRPALVGLWALVFLSLLAGTTISTLFAVEASRQAKAEAAARARVEEVLAEGYLRPLGHASNEEPNPYELAVLREVASLPPEQERVRLLFIERALSAGPDGILDEGQDDRVGQLDRRLEHAVHAAVGLSEARRQEVLKIAWRVLQDEKSPRQHQLVSLRIAALLQARNRDLVYLAMRRSLDLLADSPQRQIRQDSQLTSACVEFTHGLAPQQAEVAAEQVKKLLNTKDAGTLVGLILMLSRLSDRIGDRAAPDRALVVDQVLKLLGTSSDANQTQSLNNALALASAKLPRQAVEKAARELLDMMADPATPRRPGKLSTAFATLVQGLDEKAVSAVTSRALELLSENGNAVAHRSLADALPVLLGRLNQKETPEKTARVLELVAKERDGEALAALVRAYGSIPISQETSPRGHGDTAVPIYVKVMARLVESTNAGARVDPEEANLHALTTLADALPSLVARMSEAEASTCVAHLSRLLGKARNVRILAVLIRAQTSILGKLDGSAAKKATSELAELLLKAMDGMPNGPSMLALLRAFELLANRLDEGTANLIATTATANVFQLLKSSEDVAMISALARAFGPVASRLSSREAEKLAADALKAMKVNKDSYVTAGFIWVWKAVRVKLAPARVRRDAFDAASWSLELFAFPEDSNAVTLLGEAFDALLTDLPKEDIANLAAVIREKFGTRPSGLALEGLGRAFASLVKTKRLDSAVARSGGQMIVSRQINTHQKIERSALVVLDALTDQDLVSVLKHPCCLGLSRAAVLEVLGRRCNRSFHSPWEYVEWAEVNATAVNLRSPFSATGLSEPHPR